MKIYSYAILKEHFGKELEIDDAVENINGLQQLLTARSPAAKDILEACRYAVKDNFVSGDFQLHPNDQIHIIPPSSGG